jgi:DNA polymerase-3 subunit delta'
LQSSKEVNDHYLESELLPWHQHQWNIFIRQVQHKKLAHAYLLCGAENLGKSQFALTMAKWILCKQFNPSECNMSCQGCILLNSNSHPDLIHVNPSKKNTDIKIDQIRDFTEIIAQTAKLGGYKVAILSPADNMNKYAANALLKTLEEPSADTVIILVSSNQAKLLPTIRSRCQKIIFTNPSLNISSSWLANKVSNQEKIKELLYISNNSPIKAADNSTAKKNYYQEFVKAISNMLKGKKSIVETAKDLQDHELDNLLSWMLGWINDSIIFALTKDKQLIHEASFAIAKFFSSNNTIVKLFELHDYLIKQQKVLIQHINTNKQMLMEAIFCRYIELVM